MKIVNIKKFVRMIGIIIGITMAISFYFTNTAYSTAEIEKKDVYISNGDTLWSIASYESENNIYYKGKDIRDIVGEIKELNNLENNTILQVGQKIVVNSL